MSGFSLLLAVLAAGGLRAQDGPLQDVLVRPGDTLWSLSQQYLKDPKSWNEILRFNRLPTSDPTVALPGMTLKIPISLIKEDLRAATLEMIQSSVLFRKKNTAAWSDARPMQHLYNDDGLRTLEKSWARVKFFGGAVLSLDPNSMAILKAPKPEDRFLELKRGTVHGTAARVVTPSARVIPKNEGTKYTARVLEDLSTRVQVFTGEADVQDSKGKNTVNLKAGFYTDVKLDRLPTPPVKIPNIEKALQAEIDGLGQGGGEESVVKVRRAGVPAGSSLASQIQELSVGVPVAAYQVQIAREQEFKTIIFDKMYESYSPIDLLDAALPGGNYWVRVSIIDLLGEKGRWSEPKPYRTGQEEKFESLAFQGNLDVLRPEAEEITIGAPRYRIAGRTGAGLKVSINGNPVSTDEDGYFSMDAALKVGNNPFRIASTDARGNSRVVNRNIIFKP